MPWIGFNKRSIHLDRLMDGKIELQEDQLFEESTTLEPISEDAFSWLLLNCDSISGNAATSTFQPFDFTNDSLYSDIELESTKSESNPVLLENELNLKSSLMQSSGSNTTTPTTFQESEEDKKVINNTTANSTLNHMDRKRRRLMQNRESARESRRKKSLRDQEIDNRLRRLQAINLDLKLRLNIGKEALAEERRKKDEVKAELQNMLNSGASEEEIAKCVESYKKVYSDYGPNRRLSVKYHLQKIKDLLLPTQVTKMCMYSVEQGSTLGDDDSSLSAVLIQHLGLTEEQQKVILERRERIRNRREDLKASLRILKELEDTTERKNLTFDQEISELQSIIKPTQTAKFILWVKDNPAFMYMLNKLFDPIIKGKS